ncbi:MAG: nitrate ABC transporter, permease protein, partial [Bradyrhizobium sp.]
MSMIAMKTETSEVATPPATAAAPVVTMTPKRAPRAETYARLAKETAARVVPPLIVVALLLVV